MFQDKYRLVIKITKGDKAAQVISRMQQGTIIGFNEKEKAIESLVDFVSLASFVIHETNSDFDSFGVACIQDEETGELTNITPLCRSKKT